MSCYRNAIIVILVVVAGSLMAGQASATVISTPNSNSTGFTLNSDTLGESATITASNVETFVPAKLQDGILGALDDYDNATLGEGSSITYSFDVSSHPLGYDITRIESYAGGATDPDWGSRSNQGYQIELTYVDNSTALLVPNTVWIPCPVMNDWSQMIHTNSGGGALDNDSGVVATGVKAVTFSGFNGNWAYVPQVRYREFDIVGSASVPEPGTMMLMTMGLVSALAYAWRKRK